MIASRMSQVLEHGRKVWRCLECHKESQLKADISRHVEANHISHPGFDCYYCYKHCKTRDALRCHINKYHKQIWIKRFPMFIKSRASVIQICLQVWMKITSRPWTMRYCSGWCQWRTWRATRPGSAWSATRMEARLTLCGMLRQTILNTLDLHVLCVVYFQRTEILLGNTSQ